ncbi:hypothetical protein FJZ28_01330 [Candidatus Peregrinibacteria bacterium]|nr:hypothetical protein [Candidatus Peregrinibacteria bacterium]
MNTLFTFATLLALGVIGLSLIKVAKNVAYLIFLLMIGWMIWLVAAPYVAPQGQSVSETAMKLGDEFAEAATKDMNESTRVAGDSIAESVTEDVGEMYDAARAGEGTDAWKTKGSGDYDQRTQSFYQRMTNILKRILQSLIPQ